MKEHVSSDLIYKSDLIQWLRDSSRYRDLDIEEIIGAIEDGDFDEILPMWSPAFPRIKAVLEQLVTEKRIESYKNTDIDCICQWIAEDGDPCSLRGTRLYNKVMLGLEEGRW